MLVNTRKTLVSILLEIILMIFYTNRIFMMAKKIGWNLKQF